MAAMGSIAALLAACAQPPESATASGDAGTSASNPRAASPAPVPAASREPVVIGTPAAPAPAEAAPRGGSLAGQTRTFSTRMAVYTSVPFASLPGWERDDLAESWPAFLTSCRVLTSRGAQWKHVCAQARSVDAQSAPAIRGFFEREFAAYQIRDDDRRADGVVTGYFEPEIEGSRNYAPPFIYPVYAQPQDMLYLDTRSLPAGDAVVNAVVKGRNVAVQPGGGAGAYTLDLSQIVRDTADRKARLRIEGRQLKPYYTRAEIETLGAPNAKVLAFVNNAMQLYEMQIQGSGRIRLKDGDVIRVGYAEQNGQPFRPTIAKGPGGKPRTAVRTRGSAIELELDDDDDSGLGDESVIRTRGFTLARPLTSGAVVVPGRSVNASIKGSGIQDPSYVFFREISEPAANGPLGALGVPLKAGRSIAVDPRATPLGYPVFVSTRVPGSSAPMQRLTIAQDTGGAIRGAVRADYFFGNGDTAAKQARRMKERGQLWILLPRGQVVASASSHPLPGLRTRGVGNLPNCLVADDENCAD
ncbi:murein transglycosylase A [Diaphorobacter aerolatus]|uniref:peptidoglycan lytic exotransglycosylase n=2 Tax=Diaphorobacter aerolatus TaxID=1288495 RepID=A0A7H0GQ15_9BURK|nr:murein transglycosylase A [Diaphorobacter aerolatus]QNP50381.1 murein transglycosylase A [Diaphorobacter aerolatus]